MKYVLEEEKFNNKRLYVIYEQGNGAPDIPIYEHGIKVQAVKYLKALKSNPRISASW